jgi:hypothetical protein
MPDADPRLVAAATALAMTDLRRSGKTAPAVLERVLPYYMRAAEVCVSAYLATPAQLSASAPEAEIERLREALRSLRIYLKPNADGTHAAIGEACGVDACIVCLAEHTIADALTADADDDPVPDEVREAQDVTVEEWAERSEERL